MLSRSNCIKGIASAACFFLPVLCLWSVEADDLVGLWYGPPDNNGRSVVLQFFADGEGYNAVPVGYWGTDQGRNDSHDKKHARVFMLSEITRVYGLRFTGSVWKDGTVHNPIGGVDFTLRVKINDDNQTAVLRVSADRYGVIGMNLTWTRVPLKDYSNYGSLSPDERKMLFQ